MSTLFDKYIVKKAHGSTDPNAQYFVLRIDTDPAARAALLVYADQVKYDDPEFAKELQAWVFVYTEAAEQSVHVDTPLAFRCTCGSLDGSHTNDCELFTSARQ